MTKECKQQFTLRISQANESQMIVILYEMSLCYVREAKEAHGLGDRTAFREGIRKARGCINELMRSLDMDYDISSSLLQLYLFCIRRLAYADVRCDVYALGETEGVIDKLRDAYDKVAQQNTNGPVMQHSQSVYAGLTYGKNSLTENLSDQGGDRGLLV